MSVSPNAFSPESMRPIAPEASTPVAVWQLLGRGVRSLVMLATVVVTGVVLVAFGATALGYDQFVISGGSMEPAVPAGALVIADRVLLDEVRVGEVVTFRRSSAPDSPVTHRVVRIDENAGQRQVWTQGDANASMDAEPLTESVLVSRVRLTLPMAGYVLGFLRTSIGQVLLIAGPALYLIGRLVLGRGGVTSVAETPVAAESRAALTSAMASMAALFAAAATGALTVIAAAIAAIRLRMPLIAVPTLRVPSVRVPARLASTVTSMIETRRPRGVRQGTALPRAVRMGEVAAEPAAVSAEFEELVALGLGPMATVARELEAGRMTFEQSMAESLRPLTEYAAQLERNLAKLERKLQGEQSESWVGTTFAAHVASERARIDSVYAAIEEAKAPLRATLEREHSALDALLSPLDAEVESVASMVRRQRMHLAHVVNELQSERFAAAVATMQQRADSLGQLAASGVVQAEQVQIGLSASAGTVGVGAGDDGVTAMPPVSPYLESALAVLSDGAGTGERGGETMRRRPAA